MHPPAATLFDWGAFAGAVVALMAVDFGVFGRIQHMSFRVALVRSLMCLGVGLGFAGFVYARMGTNASLLYLTAYLVEESLSVDNLFVFLVLFNYFGLTESKQQRVLFWGIAGAIVMRGVFIGAGEALLHRFHWMMYVFGAFLIYTGAKLLLRKEEESNPEDNPALKLARRYIRTTPDYHGDQFWVIKDGKRYATPLFLVLIVIELTDVIFAVDSVPAVLAISHDTFIIYTSNIMAILGLRALYFVLSGMMGRFHHLGTGLALILLFIGAKMVAGHWVHLPTWVSLGVIVVVLAGSIGISLLHPQPVEGPPGTS
ncbi:MAG: TerC family protein [Polyangiaceae bacterium]|nr:TerC family protein [Polyangiaceae bacterium]